MDTKPGRCWRCDEKLQQAPLGCDLCRGPPAYCSSSCRSQDEARHQAVECKMYGPKACTLCGKNGNTKECVQCNTAWYCNEECQKQDWKTHKQLCKEQKHVAVSMAFEREQYLMSSTFRDTSDNFPHYFGNTPAVDFLRLETNEWSDGQGQTEAQRQRDFHVLSAGCGNLRNTVITAASLPTEYQGCLHITLNDNDLFVMARNVLLLYLLAQLQDGQDIASKVATIWSSLRLPVDHYELLTASLDKLLAVRDAEGLREVTRGLINLLAGDLEPMRRVWSCWWALDCRQGQPTSINLGQHREYFLRSRANNDHYLPSYLSKQSQIEQHKMKKWLDHGLFLPAEPTDDANHTLPFDNPTLTGKKFTSEYEPLMYSMNQGDMPFTEWDFLHVRQSIGNKSYPSPMVMYHDYLTSHLLKVRQLILQGRLRISIAFTDFQQLPAFHRSKKLPCFDRIFTSNLSDYTGIPVLLRTLKPMLNANNPCSVLVTESMMWEKFARHGDISDDNPKQTTPAYALRAFLNDPLQICPVVADNFREFLDNTAVFMQYLRADISAGELGEEPRLLPTFTQVKSYHGMRMRDFRKELNRLVPFRYRVNVRPLTLVDGMERAVEWCLPPHSDD